MEHKEMRSWLAANPQANVQDMQAKAASLGLNWWQLMMDGLAVMTAIGTAAANPALKGTNSVAVDLTNLASGQSQLIPVPEVTITF